MAQTAVEVSPASNRPSWLRKAIVKIATLVILGVVFGWAYAWAVPRLYGPERTAGYWVGIVHGGLMPIALPSLLMGKDVPIFTAQNTGRTYKLGYICGINMCGLLFFGMAFHRPREPKRPMPPVQ